MDESCNLVDPLAAEKQVVISRQLRPAVVVGDRDRLAEAIANLLTNAVAYNREHGRVDVSLRTIDMRVELHVADTGPGIPQDQRELVFDRFFRVDMARSNSVGGSGSGLGLAITKWVVDAHGGDILCRENADGGATFVVRLQSARDDST